MTENQNRKLAAILFADIVGYTSLMQKDESLALQKINRYQSLLDSAAQQFNGQVLKNYGDGSLMTFSNSLDAVKAAKQIQEQAKTELTVPLRIGIHVGEFIVKKGDIYGNGVNIASRLETLGVAGSVLFSKNIFQKIKNHPEIKTKSLGMFRLKNVTDPIEIFALTNNGFTIPTISNKNSSKVKAIISSPKPQRWIPIAILLLSICLVFFWIKLSKVDSETRIGEESVLKPRAIISEKSIAVLPFLNMSNDSESEYFSDGIMEDILTNLTKIPELKVISRTSAMRYKGSKKSVPQIASELGVRYILEGNVRKYNDNIRITAQLIRAGEDTHLWAENYNRTIENIFAIQSEVSKSIADQLNIKINPEVENLLDAVPTQNMKAYDLYVRGRQLLQNRTYEDIQKSIQLFEQAIELDPNFAHAIAELGNCYHLYFHYGYENRDSSAIKANELSHKALSLHKAIARSYNIIGVDPLKVGRKDFIFETMTQLKKGLKVSPNDIQLLHHTAFLFIPMKRFDEATFFAKKALELDPYSPIAHANYLRVLIYTRQFELATKQLQESTQLFPGSFLIKKRQQELLYYQGKCKKLKAQLDEWKSGQKGDSPAVFYSEKGLCNCYAIEGNRDKVNDLNCDDEWIEVLLEKNKDEAFRLLKENKFQVAWLLGSDYRFNFLRSDPRYETIMQEYGFSKVTNEQVDELMAIVK